MILMFIYPIYNHNWRNISTIYIYITRLASNEIFSPSNEIHREVGRAKDLLAVSLKNLSRKIRNTDRNDMHNVKFLSEHCLDIPCTEVKWTSQERTSVFDCETRHVHIRQQHEKFPPKSCVLFR